jgi:putative peptidoglycan lipid II flippase
MAFRLISFGRQSVQQASTLLVVTSLLSNVLGLARNLVFYRLIPPAWLDVYLASFRLSDFFFNLLVFGAIASAVIPVLNGLVHEKDEKQAFAVTNQLATWAVTAFIILDIVLFLEIRPVTHLLVPSFNASQFALSVKLNRLMLLQPILFAVSFIVGGLLNSYRHFGAYALAPLSYNTALIVGGLLYPHFGILAITGSVIVGTFLHFLVQYREAYAVGFRLRPTWEISPQLRQIVKLMLPRNLALAFGQLVPTVYTALASGLPQGSISVFSGLNDIQTTPTVVIANSLATAAFPTITAAVKDGNSTELNRVLGKVLRTALFVLVPLVAISLILRAQIVRLYIYIGHTHWGVSDQVAITTFAWFMIGIVPASLIVILTRVFYAHHDNRTPMLVAIFGSAVSIAWAVIGVTFLHKNVSVFAIAESVTAFIECALYLVILYRRKYIHLPIRQIGIHFRTYLIGSLIMVWLTWASLQAMGTLYGKVGIVGTNHIIGLLVQTLVASAVGVAAYFGYSTLESKEELKWLRKRAFSSDK